MNEVTKYLRLRISEIQLERNQTVTKLEETLVASKGLGIDLARLDNMLKEFKENLDQLETFLSLK